MAIEKFYHENNLKRFITLKEFRDLRQIRLSKGSELYTNSSLFLVNGCLEVFYSDIDGEHIKIRDLLSKDIIVGKLNLTLDHNLHFSYKAKKECILLEISDLIADVLLKNIEFYRLLISLFYDDLKIHTADALMNRKYSSGEKIKYFLKKEVTKNNTIHLDNVATFLDNYGLNKATYYKELKNLIKTGYLSKKGKKLKINDI